MPQQWNQCTARMLIPLIAAATHYPLLRKFLHDVHTAIRSHVFVHDIDQALCAGDFRALMELIEMIDFETVLTNDVYFRIQYQWNKSMGDLYGL